jgi:hypothetical protein
MRGDQLGAEARPARHVVRQLGLPVRDLLPGCDQLTGKVADLAAGPAGLLLNSPGSVMLVFSPLGLSSQPVG